MGCSSFALTFVTSMPRPKKMPTPCHICKRPWRAWLVPNTFRAWTRRVGSGKSKWPKSPNNTLPSQWEAWACMNSYACLRAVQCPGNVPMPHAKNCLGELNLTYALIYLDDVIVYSKMEEEHPVRLRTVLERFMEHGLKLKLSKCNFFHTEISYLGHKVSAARMEPGTEGLKGITEIMPPITYTQVHKFLGTTGYFRCFIKGYARIAKPLNDLLQGENSKLKSQLLGLPPDALTMFQELKMKCLIVPVLVFTDFKKPFLLETDVSIEGLGVVLSQKKNDSRYHPIAYAS